MTSFFETMKKITKNRLYACKKGYIYRKWKWHSKVTDIKNSYNDLTKPDGLYYLDRSADVSLARSINERRIRHGMEPKFDIKEVRPGVWRVFEIQK